MMRVSSIRLLTFTVIGIALSQSVDAIAELLDDASVEPIDRRGCQRGLLVEDRECLGVAHRLVVFGEPDEVGEQDRAASGLDDCGRHDQPVVTSTRPVTERACTTQS